MAKLTKTQLLPSTSGLKPSDELKDSLVKLQFTRIHGWAAKIVAFLDDTFRKVASIPFNQSERYAVADTGSADTEFTVSHYLGRTPAGYILSKSDKACNIYDSGTTWTTTALYLKCDAANAAIELYVF